jgi:uncharacterized protein
MGMKKLIFLLFVISVTTTAIAQKVTLENTLLWRVSGNGLGQNSYIYLTGKNCNEKLSLNKSAIQAAKEVNNIVVEYDLYGSKDAGKLAKNNLAYADSLKIKNNLSAAQIAAFENKMKDAGYPAQAIPQLQIYRLNMIYYMLSSLAGPCGVQSQGLVYELELRQLSKKLNKEFSVLQTIDEYIITSAKADNLYWKSNISYLLENEETSRGLMKLEADLYKEGNVKDIQKLYDENTFYMWYYKTTMQKEYAAFLADKIEVGLKQVPGFFFIQLSNVVYTNYSVFEALAAKGYTITPVFE